MKQKTKTYLPAIFCDACDAPTTWYMDIAA